MSKFRFSFTVSRRRDQAGSRERQRGFVTTKGETQEEAREKAKRKVKQAFREKQGWDFYQVRSED